MKSIFQKYPKRIVGLLLFVLVGLAVLISQRQILRQYYKQAVGEVRKFQAVQMSYATGAGTPVTPVKTKVSPKDGMQLVYIPAGEFLMGSDDNDDPASQPAHKVHLDAFWIDKTEVTNALYAKCVNSKNCLEPLSQSSGPNKYYGKAAYANDPVIYVSWYYAQMYCVWAGRRLPTEAQWEKAARGTDGRIYPWGNNPPDMNLLNFDGNIGEPVTADRYPLGASPYGVLNMAGNLREWVGDWFSPVYYRDLPSLNPKGPPTGMLKSLRGGAFDDHARDVRTFERFGHDPTSAGRNRGFRCAVADKP